MTFENKKLMQMTVRQRLSPFPNYMSMECISKEMAKVIGINYEFVLIIFKKRMAYVFFDEKDYEKVGKQALKNVLKKPKLFHELVAFVDKKGSALVRQVKKQKEKPLSNYSNKELSNMYKGFEKEYKQIYSRYFVILAVEKLLSEYLKTYLKKLESNDSKLEEEFTTLITEPRAQINRLEKVAALKLAKKIIENKSWKNYFSKKNVVELVKKDSELDKLFTQHEENYYWITRDYEDSVLTYNDFVKRMKVILKDQPLKKLVEEENFLKSVDKNIISIEKKLGIDSKHSRLFEAVREGIHLKEFRKMYVSQLMYHYDPILEEISKRAKLSLAETRHLTSKDVLMALEKKNLKPKMKERYELSIFQVNKGKSNIITGPKAEEIYNDLCLAKKDVSELKGLSASPGKTTGPVRIIMNPDEISKVQKGDIIVSGQIVPSFAPALKRAAGMVCDGGTGVTSHPAILAREAKIPCVVKTNIATQVLKDGDLVEVDGYKGIVKKINKTNKFKYTDHKFTPIANDYHSHIFRNYLWIESFELQAKEFKTPQISFGIVSDKNSQIYAGDMVAWVKSHNKLKEYVQKDIYYVDKLIDTIVDMGEQLVAWTKKEIRNKDLTKYSDEELFELYEQCSFKMQKLYAYGTILPVLDFANFSFVEGNLKKILEKKTKNKEEYDLYYDILTYPHHNSYAQDQEEALLKFTAKYYSDEWKKDVLTKSLTQIKKKYSFFAKDLEAHTSKHGWVYYVYSGPAYTENQFLEFIKEILKEGKDPKKTLKEIQTKNKEIKKQRTKLILKLKLNKFDSMILNLAGKMVWSKPRRKDYQSRGYYEYEKLFLEIGKRLKINLEQVRNLTPEMLKESLKTKKVDKKKLAEIKNYYALLPTKDGSMLLLTGKEAREYNNSIKVAKEAINKEDNLKGMVACRGMAKGTVRIINVPGDMSKMNVGDILVSTATTPSIVAAMKKAAAIVTDEGGLTCHAAIVSREMNKPCVIGTKIATAVLKDGDYIEVDAEVGIVRKIKEKPDWTVLRSRYIPALWPFMIYWVWDVEKEMNVSEVKVVHAWKEGSVWAIWSKQSLGSLGINVLEKLRTWNHKTLRQKGYTAGENCLKYVKEFSKKDHSPTEYMAFFKKFTELYVELMRYNMSYWLFAGKALEKKLSSEIKDESIIRIMSMPKEESYSAKEEQEFQSLVDMAKKGFDKKTTIAIKKFVEKYYWFPYEYVGPDIWTEESVTKRIKDSLNNKDSSKKEDIAKKQTELIKKYDFSKETIKDFELLQFCTLLQDDRKMYHSHICYYVNELIMRRMAKTLKITFGKARLVEENVLGEYIKTKNWKSFDKELSEREKFLVVGRKKAGENYFFSGKNGEKFLEEEQVKLPIPTENISEVKGLVAFKGKVRGRARVLRTSQVKDFKEGDIIISGMTTPDFVPLIKKAGAIVTDEGGITCHAAIVARELKKPCIIGTENATQVFKDGDYIEVDAEVGIVRKIKEKAVLKQSYSRHKGAGYMMVWDISEYLGFKDFIDYDIKKRIFIYDPQTEKTSVWHNSEEFKHIENLVFEKVRTEKNRFTSKIIDRLDTEWKIIIPYLSRKKKLKTVKEFDKFLSGIIRWWSAMNTVYPLIQNPQVSKKHAKIFLQYRVNSEQYTGAMDELIVKFWKERVPKKYQDLVFVCTSEESKLLAKNKLSKKEEQDFWERKKGFIIFNKGIILKRDEDKFLEENNFELYKEQTENITSVKGMVAYKGFARGPVRRIIKKSDIRDFKEGEILVAEITFPEHVPAMQKAGAIVTDEGGITCHAAIVSRELKKPCVIGTKIGTKVFKNGDVVEVDAETGVIKKVDMTWKFMVKRDQSVLFYELITSGEVKDNIKQLLNLDFHFDHYRSVDHNISLVTEELNQVSLFVKKYFKKEGNNFIAALLDKWYSFFDELENLANKISRTDYSNKSNEELLLELNRLKATYFKCSTALAIPFPIESLAENILRDKVSKFEKSSEYFNILTTSIKPTGSTNEQIDFLAILIRKQQGKNVLKEIDDHVKKYSWIGTRGFRGDEWIKEDVLKRMDLLDRCDAKKEYQSLINHPKEVIKQTAQVLKEINANADFKEFVNIVKEYVFFRTYRMEEYTRLGFLARPLFKEIAKRIGLDLNNILNLLSIEIIDALENKTDYKKILTKRKKGFLYLKSKDTLTVLAGKEFEEYKKKEKTNEEKINLDVNEVKGMTASNGIVRGPVKIVDTKNEINVVSEGDILITSMTTPDFIPAMEKAIAFVTDEGGILCHAAIVSREMKKPCVIGTKIATQVFKDGDYIEVDANTGTVKKISKNSIPKDLLDNLDFFCTRPMTAQRDILAALLFWPHKSRLISIPANGNNRSLYTEAAGMKTTYKDMLKKVDTSSKLKKHLKEYTFDMNKMLKVTKELKNTSITNVKESLYLFNGFFEAFTKFGKYLTLPFAIEKYLEPELRSLIKKEKLDSEYALKIISSPSQMNEYQRMRIAIIDSALNKKYTIKQLVDKFSWYGEYAYVEPLLDATYFKKEIKKITNSEGKKEKKQICAAINEVKLNYPKILKQIKNKRLKLLVELVQNYTIIRDGRIDALKKSQVNIRFFFEKVAKLLTKQTKQKWDGKLVANMLILEIEDFLKQGIAPNYDLMKKRLNQEYIFYFDGKSHVFYNDVEKTRDYILDKYSTDEDLIKGTIAQKGKATGCAKIIRKKSDLRKIQEGDVMVAKTTMPDYTIVMKKCSAIITDEGGIVSHAAIVSRELKIPCIVNTKSGTTKLNDGDYVEVDANNGTVKKITKENSSQAKKDILLKPRISVLHVEDNKKIFDSLRKEFNKKGIYSHTVSNFKDAFDLIKEINFDIIVCDGKFPYDKDSKSESNFMKVVDLLKQYNKKTKLIFWANSTTVHEYALKNKIEAYSKIQLQEFHFSRRGRKFQKVKCISPKELAVIVENELMNVSLMKEEFKKPLVHMYKEPAYVMPAVFATDSRTAHFESTVGMNYSFCHCEFKKGVVSVYIDPSNDGLIADKIYDRIVNENFFPELLSNVISKADSLLKLSRSFKSSDLSKYSNNKLANILADFYKKYIEMRVYSSIPTAIEHVSNRWSNYLLTILEKKISNPEEINKVFPLLTTPERLSYLKEFELEVSRMAIKKSKFTSKTLAEKYAWIRYAFEGKPINSEFVKKELSKLSKKEHQELLLTNKKRVSELRKSKQVLYEKYSFTSSEKELFNYGAEMVWIKFFRKGIFAESNYCSEFLQREIAKRIKFSEKQIKLLLPSEMMAALKTKTFPKEIVNLRAREFFMFCKNGRSYIFPYNKRDLFNKPVAKQISSDTFKGTSAYNGIISGIVKIVNTPKDLDKVNIGDVLVSRSTNPNILPAMRKAAAFVTEVGGLTCHAAIIAREMKKPCVIGAEGVTSALKDGDYVKVDADSGIVKKTNGINWREVVASRKWYKQAADTEPIYSFATTATGMSEMDYPVFFFYDRVCTAFFSVKEMAKEGREIFEKTKKNPKYVDKRINDCTVYSNKLVFLMKKLSKIDFFKADLEALRKSLMKFHQINCDYWYRAYFVDKLDPEGELDLKSEIKKSKIKISHDELTSILRSQKKNFIENSNLDLFKLALKLQGKKLSDKELLVHLKPYTKKYYYIKNSWNKAFILTEKDFLLSLKQLLRDSKDRLKELIFTHEHLELNAKKKTKELELKLKIPESLKNVFYLFRTLTAFRDDRKEIVLNCINFYELLAQRFAKEYDIKLSLLRKALPKEVLNIKSKSDAKQLVKILRKRKTFVIGHFKRSEGIKLISGSEVDEMLSLFFNQSVQEDNVLKGSVACKGSSKKISGRVKVILGESHFGNFEKDDILVASMTRPEYVPLMKQAKAIITDEGGITCHAAIISRELNVPCIIGTQKATRTLANGDYLELDLVTGHIKKIDEKEYKPLKQIKVKTEIKKMQKVKTDLGEFSDENVLWFKDLNKDDIPIVGGKGANLGEMFHHFNIPNGFCVTVHAYRRFLEETTIGAHIHGLLDDLDVEDTTDLDKVSKEIRNLILKQKFPNDLRKDVLKNYNSLKYKKVAVRSSATAEDLPGASFAGQQDTYLNIKGDNEIINAVQKCWASLFTSRAIYYREKNNFKHRDVLISVVIQEMIDAKHAGVMFTIDPVNKKHILIELVEGLGEALVSGQVTPNTYFMNKKTHKLEQEVLHFDVPIALIEQVSKVGERIEKHYKKPQDIEFAFNDKGELFILQSRPITTL